VVLEELEDSRLLISDHTAVISSLGLNRLAAQLQ
jgi:hypothetical protein